MKLQGEHDIKDKSKTGGEEALMKKVKVPFSCPICGRKTEYPSEDLIEGAVLTCSFCKLKLTLHGHMLEDVQKEIKKLK